MKVWVDDVRAPAKFGRVGWTWAKTYEEAVELLRSGEVEAISLDHDLSFPASIGQAAPEEKTGYDIVLFMQQNNVWPGEIVIHSFNPAGRRRMAAVLDNERKPYRIEIAMR